MRVELIELLRCPNDHEPAPLVTVAYERDGDRLVEGALGCPVCHASFALHQGAVYLDHHVHGQGSESAPPPTAVACDRLAALLNLTEPAMRVALCGVYAELAPELTARTDALCVAMNNGPTDPLYFIPTRRFPLANGALQAIAIDQTHHALLADVTRVVRVGGRVVAPADLAIPPGCLELARDATEWVAHVTHAAPESTTPVTLRRGSAYGETARH